MASPETTFHSTPVVCAALSIPSGTLNSWAARGWLDGLGTPSEGRGRRRAYSTVGFLTLALIKAASDFRVAPGLEFYGFAPRVVRDWFEYPQSMKQLVIRFYKEPDLETSIRYNDDLHKEPPKPGWAMSIAFDLRAIFEPALNALADAERQVQQQQAAPTVIEPINPLLTAIKRTK
jgi:hypothetical protein